MEEALPSGGDSDNYDDDDFEDNKDAKPSAPPAAATDQAKKEEASKPAFLQNLSAGPPKPAKSNDPNDRFNKLMQSR